MTVGSIRDRAHPLTVVVCTYNRAVDLAVTLDGLRDFACREVIVVDNGSTDDTANVLDGRTDVRVVHLGDNVGVPGFAVGVAHAVSPYVLMLDDDAIPDPEVSDRVVQTFDSEPTVAAIACRVLTPEGVDVTSGWPTNPLLFWGCGAGVRQRLAADFEPMFYPRLFLHGTELDLSVRLYADGWEVRFDPESLVVHRFSAVNRTSARRLRTVTHASVRFAWDHFSLRGAIAASVSAALYRARSIRGPAGALAWLRGLADVAGDIPDIRSRRRVVPAQVEAAYRRGVWEYNHRARRDAPTGMRGHVERGEQAPS